MSTESSVYTNTVHERYNLNMNARVQWKKGSLDHRFIKCISEFSLVQRSREQITVQIVI